MTRTCQTQRLVLRAPVLADAPALARHANDIAVARWLLRMPHPYALSDAEGWIRTHQASSSGGETYVIDLGGEAVGAIGTKGEFGYWLGRAHWGHGYVPEAARVVLRAHFEAGGGPLRSSHALDNPRSAKVLEACGFQPTGEEQRRRGTLPSQDHIHRLMRLTAEGFAQAVGRAA